MMFWVKFSGMAVGMAALILLFLAAFFSLFYLGSHLQTMVDQGRWMDAFIDFIIMVLCGALMVIAVFKGSEESR